jgi:very-short-patch-repair endonuclease
MTQSALEREFALRWRQLAPDAPEPVREYRFHPVRRFRLDFAWPEQRVAVEAMGGTYTRGRHTRGAGYRADCEKLNLLQADGWRCFYVTADMLRDDPAGVVAMVREAICD